MEEVKVGIIGFGNMGSKYAINLHEGKIPHAKLTAVCVTSESSVNRATKLLGDKVEYFQELQTFFNQANVDAVIIATPHYSHPDIAIKAFQKGLHVLLEKPAGVYTKNVIEMNQIAKKSGKVFSMMFNNRTNPIYQKLRALIQSGELGEIKRTSWVVTDFYRSQSYYDSSHWRATWEGEGGGVLINQAAHQLDLWQWTTGLMPKRIYGFCENGKYHHIEVEDNVTAYIEYENGATGTFICSTGEAPGTNRVEIVGDRGKIVLENDQLIFHRLTQSEREFNRTHQEGFGAPESWEINIPITGKSIGHLGIIQNWINAIIIGEDLLIPGEEGINSLEISNAIHLSSWMEKPVELPIDADLYYEQLQKRITQSTFEKKVVSNRVLDVDQSY